ncbi:MAG: MinD/ParA family ATP-binding protein [Candidatus Dormibacteria bacterium]
MSIWAIGGGGGQPGVTTVALSITNALMKEGRSVVLVDLDADAGVLALRLGVGPTPGVFTLLDPDRTAAPSLDEIAGTISRTKGGWGLMPGFIGSDQAPLVESRKALHLLKVIDSAIDDVVVDVGRIRPGLASSICANVPHLLWVLDPAPEGAARFLGAVRSLAADDDIPGYVFVNRANRPDAVPGLSRRMERHFGLQVAATAPLASGSPETSREMQAGCLQAIRVMDSEASIQIPDTSKWARAWR